MKLHLWLLYYVYCNTHNIQAKSYNKMKLPITFLIEIIHIQEKNSEQINHFI